MLFSVRAIFSPNLYQTYNILLWTLYQDELVIPSLKAAMNTDRALNAMLNLDKVPSFTKASLPLKPHNMHSLQNPFLSN